MRGPGLGVLQTNLWVARLSPPEAEMCTAQRVVCEGEPTQRPIVWPIAAPERKMRSLECPDKDAYFSEGTLSQRNDAMNISSVFTVMIAILIYLSMFIFAVGFAHFYGSWSILKQISNEPNRGLSAERLDRRRQDAFYLLIPAFIVYLATILGGFGVNQLHESWPGLRLLGESRGALLIAVGFLAITVTISYAISRPRRDIWAIVQKLDSEQLLLYLMDKGEQASAEELKSWTERLGELKKIETCKKDRSARSHAIWQADPASISERPYLFRWRPRGKHKPRFAQPSLLRVEKWSRSTSRFSRFYAFLGMIGVVAWVVFSVMAGVASQRLGSVSLFFFLITILLLVLGLFLLICGMRLELVWLSRSYAQRNMFRDRAEVLLEESRTRLATEHEQATVEEIQRETLEALRRIENAIFGNTPPSGS